MKKLIAVLLAIVLLAGVVAGCTAYASDGGLEPTVTETPVPCEELLQQLLDKECTVVVNVNCCCCCCDCKETNTSEKTVIIQKEGTTVYEGDTIIDKSHDNYHPKDDDKVHNNGNGNNGNGADNSQGQNNGNGNSGNNNNK